MALNGHWLTTLVRDIDDFPTKGVSFRDITPLLDALRPGLPVHYRIAANASMSSLSQAST